MVKKILALLTGPFAIAFGVVALLALGAGAGVIIAGKMAEADAKRRADLKAAEEAAKRPPPPPERVRLPDQGPDPFVARYIDLGDEILSNLPARGRALIVQVALMTQKGERAEKMLTDNKIRLRALVVAVVSEITVEEATAQGAVEALAQRLLKAVNAEIRRTEGADLVDDVLIRRYFVQ
jgi:flagellar basal body-associated protein FliL